MSGTCAAALTRSLVFTVAPSSFAALLQVVLGMSTVRQFLRLLRQKRLGALGLELLLDLAP